jgi:DNA (cytosine-5)-methyltransferase 1
VSVYYNEFDHNKAAWLRELIKAGAIAKGDVDERSIKDVTGSDLRGYRQCHFFAGIGVWSYALRQAGWFDKKEVWTGSCPCQGFSAAGKRKGFADERHLWPWWFKLIRKCKPSVVFGEQVANKVALAWLDLVQDNMEGAGYAFGSVDLCAAGFGAPHARQRLFFVADASRKRWGKENFGAGSAGKRSVSSTGDGGASGGMGKDFYGEADWFYCRDGKSRATESGTFPLANWTASSMVRLHGYGDAINAEVAKGFIEAYCEARQLIR